MGEGQLPCPGGNGENAVGTWAGRRSNTSWHLCAGNVHDRQQSLHGLTRLPEGGLGCFMGGRALGAERPGEWLGLYRRMGLVQSSSL